MSQPLRMKIKVQRKHDVEIHRIRGRYTFAELQSIVGQWWPGAHLQWTYIDPEDGVDKITMSTPEEWDECVALHDEFASSELLQLGVTRRKGHRHHLAFVTDATPESDEEENSDEDAAAPAAAADAEPENTIVAPAVSTPEPSIVAPAAPAIIEQPATQEQEPEMAANENEDDEENYVFDGDDNDNNNEDVEAMLRTPSANDPQVWEPEQVWDPHRIAARQQRCHQPRFTQQRRHRNPDVQKILDVFPAISEGAAVDLLRSCRGNVARALNTLC